MMEARRSTSCICSWISRRRAARAHDAMGERAQTSGRRRCCRSPSRSGDHHRGRGHPMAWKGPGPCGSRLPRHTKIVIEKARERSPRPRQIADDGTNDLLMSEVLRTNEMQVWFIAEHLVDVPIVRV